MINFNVDDIRENNILKLVNEEKILTELKNFGKKKYSKWIWNRKIKKKKKKKK